MLPTPQYHSILPAIFPRKNQFAAVVIGDRSKAGDCDLENNSNHLSDQPLHVVVQHGNNEAGLPRKLLMFSSGAQYVP